MVAEIGDAVAVMYGGQVVGRGPADAVQGDPQHPCTIGLLESVPRLRGPRARLAAIDGSVPGIGAMPARCRFRDRRAFAAGICAGRPALRELGEGHAAACHFAPPERHLAVAG